MSKSFKLDQPPEREKPSSPRLTDTAHLAICRNLYPGAYAVDATVGNGHDTLFLARHVGPGGHVHGFDIQAGAIEIARGRIEDAGLASLATLHPCGHEEMLDALPEDMAGNTSAILFNLGYLPGGDKSVTTLSETTLLALEQAWGTFLAPGGILSVLAYPGHPAGRPEAESVLAWLGRLGGEASIQEHPSPGPVLYLVTKRQL